MVFSTRERRDALNEAVVWSLIATFFFILCPTTFGFLGSIFGEFLGKVFNFVIAAALFYKLIKSWVSFFLMRNS